MHTSFPAIDALAASKTPIHFNLGTIGRIESYQVGRYGPWVLPTKDFHGALVETNPGLPRPPRDIDAKLLRVPHGMPLVLLAATHHNVAYYVLCELNEKPAQVALRWASDLGRLEIGFIHDAEPAIWSAMHFDQQVRERLQAELADHKERRSARDESWRDKLGLLLLTLPSLLLEADASAGRCSHHVAVLLSGNRAMHANRLV